MELISRGNVCLEEQRDRLEQIIDVSESNIDVQTVLLGPIIRGKCVLFVGLGCSGCARDLNQLCHFNREWELALRCLY